MKTLTIDWPVRASIIEHVEITLHQEASGRWHWLMAVPGKLVLSGSAPSESTAVDNARNAVGALTHLVA